MQTFIIWSPLLLAAAIALCIAYRWLISIFIEVLKQQMPAYPINFKQVGSQY